jgi:hypothetical protein
VLRTAGIGRDERQVELGLDHVRELDLGLLRRFAESLERLAILPQVDPLILAELLDEEAHDALVPIIAAEVSVSVRGLHLDQSLAHLEDRDVEGPAAQVEHQDRLVGFLLEA